LFLISPAIWAFGALQRVDLLAVVFALFAVYCALLYPASPIAVMLAGAATGAAFLCKPTVVAAACSVVGWLVLKRRMPALVYCCLGFAIVLGSAALLLGSENVNGYVFNQSINARMPLVPSNLISGVKSLAQSPGVIVLCALTVLATVRWFGGGVRQSATELLLIYVAVAGILNTVFSARLGSSVNYFGEFIAALSLCAGIEVSRRFNEPNGGSDVVAVLLGVALLANVLVLNGGSFRGRVLVPAAKMPMHEEVIRYLTEHVRQSDAVASQYPDLVLRAGRRLLFNEWAIYTAGPPEIRAIFQRAIDNGSLGTVITLGEWAEPGYVRVGPTAHADPYWGTTRADPGPLLYRRASLSVREE
jgi:hypothetical protein